MTNYLNEPQTRGNVKKFDDDRLLYKTDRMLYCIWARNNTPCSSAWPHELGTGVTAQFTTFNLKSTWSPIIHESDPGIPDGFCIYAGCFDIDLVYHPEWPNRYTSWAINRVDENSNKRLESVTVMGRLYGYQPAATTNVPVQCWDFYANTTCPGFAFSFPARESYVLRSDPTNPYCIYWNTDPGAIGMFDASTGSAGCYSIAMKEQGLLERTCSGKTPVLKRESLTLGNITNGTAAGIQLTILDTKFRVIPGFSRINMTINDTVSMLNLTNAQLGSSPNYLITFVPPTTGKPKAVFKINYVGPGPEICQYFGVFGLIFNFTDLPCIGLSRFHSRAESNERVICPCCFLHDGRKRECGAVQHDDTDRHLHTCLEKMR